MTSRLEVIQGLIDTKGYKNYLEIGIEDGYLFDKIVCENKTGVDPNAARYKGPDVQKISNNTSDDFFFEYPWKFDIIFIDGDHSYLQVVKDIENALVCLEDGGTILLHDTNPPTEEYVQDTLCSDSYKAAIYARMRKDLSVITLPIETGLTLITKSTDVAPIGFHFFKANKEHLLNLVQGETREALKNTLKI